MRWNSEGILEYGPGIKAAVQVDEEIAKYYRKLIPKYCNVNPQKYKAHITVVRTAIEVPTNMAVWDKYKGEIISFIYDGEIRTDGTYFYLRAWSDRIGDIREELGLRRYRFNDLGESSYHISVANAKNV